MGAARWLALAQGLGLFGCEQFARVSVIEQDAGQPIVAGQDAPQDAGAMDGATAPDGSTDDPALCDRPSAICNPVTNIGCSSVLAQQCAVDLISPSLAGYCTFYAPVPGEGCLNTGLTESCPPTTVCVAGACRRLCLCDAHCGTGECCTTPVSESGFKICSSC